MERSRIVATAAGLATSTIRSGQRVRQLLRKRAVIIWIALLRLMSKSNGIERSSVSLPEGDIPVLEHSNWRGLAHQMGKKLLSNLL